MATGYMRKPDYVVTSWDEQVDFSDIKLPMLVVYDHPKDRPDHVVVRLWDATRNAATNVISLHSNLWEAKAAIPERFFYLDRQQLDDPVIVGVYL